MAEAMQQSHCRAWLSTIQLFHSAADCWHPSHFVRGPNTSTSTEEQIIMALTVATPLGGMHLQPDLDNGQNLAAYQALFSSLQLPHYRRMQLSFVAQPHPSPRASRIQHEAKAPKGLISAISANVGISGKMGPKIRRQHIRRAASTMVEVN